MSPGSVFTRITYLLPQSILLIYHMGLWWTTLQYWLFFYCVVVPWRQEGLFSFWADTQYVWSVSQIASNYNYQMARGKNWWMAAKQWNVAPHCYWLRKHKNPCVLLLVSQPPELTHWMKSVGISSPLAMRLIWNPPPIPFPACYYVKKTLTTGNNNLQTATYNTFWWRFGSRNNADNGHPLLLLWYLLFKVFSILMTECKVSTMSPNFGNIVASWV